MPQTLEIDVDQLMEQMRAGREKGFSAPPRFQTTGADHGCQEPPDLPFLRSSYDIYHIEFTSHRTVLGRVVVLLKQILRQLMTPILERQCALNLAGARVASHLQEQASQIQQQVFHLQQQVEELRDQQTAALQALRQNIDALGRDQAAALEALRTDLVDQMQTFRQQVGRGLPEANV